MITDITITVADAVRDDEILMINWDEINRLVLEEKAPLIKALEGNVSRVSNIADRNGEIEITRARIWGD